MEIVIYGYTRTHKAREAAQIFFTHFSPRLIWVKLSVSLSELALGANTFLALPPLLQEGSFPSASSLSRNSVPTTRLPLISFIKRASGRHIPLSRV